MVQLYAAGSLQPYEGKEFSAGYTIPNGYEMLCMLPQYTGAWKALMSSLGYSGTSGDITVRFVLQNASANTITINSPNFAVILKKLK